MLGTFYQRPIRTPSTSRWRIHWRSENFPVKCCEWARSHARGSWCRQRPRPPRTSRRGNVAQLRVRSARSRNGKDLRSGQVYRWCHRPSSDNSAARTPAPHFGRRASRCSRARRPWVQPMRLGSAGRDHLPNRSNSCPRVCSFGPGGRGEWWWYVDVFKRSFKSVPIKK